MTDTKSPAAELPPSTGQDAGIGLERWTTSGPVHAKPLTMEGLLRLKAELGPPPKSRVWVSPQMHEVLLREVPLRLEGARPTSLASMQVLVSDNPLAEPGFNPETDLVIA